MTCANSTAPIDITTVPSHKRSQVIDESTIAAAAERIAPAYDIEPRALLQAWRTGRNKHITAARDALWAELYQLPGVSYRKLAHALGVNAKTICDGVDRHLNRQGATP